MHRGDPPEGGKATGVLVDLDQSGRVEGSLSDPFRCLLRGMRARRLLNVHTSENITPNLAQRNGSVLGCRRAPLMLASLAAEAKASKAAVHYRDYPSGMRMCHMCKFYISTGGVRPDGMPWGGTLARMMGAGACQLVEGRISPMGYCDLYAPLGA